MRSLVLTAPGHLEMREVPAPVPGPGELVLDVRAALTCGTDLKTWRRGHPKIPLPSPFGHEFAGTVSAVGAQVTAFAPGDPVMAVHSAPCATCFYCRAGQENLCDEVMETKILGAFADQILLPAHIVARNTFHKPEHLSFEEAAFLEPLACVVYALALQPLRRGETVLILGAGPVGLLFLQLARVRGAGRIVLAGRRSGRLALARELGADLVIDVDADDVLAKVGGMTAGRGADQVVECTGRTAVWEVAPRLVRKGGRVLLYGGCPGGSTVTFDTGRLHYDEITLQGAFHFTPGAVAAARELLAAREIDVRPLISGRFPLAELEQALHLLQQGEGLKYAILPGEA